jgi:hypothetical protein
MPDETRLSEAKRKLLELQRRGKLSAAADLPSRPDHEPLPWSLAQQQIWDLEQATGRRLALYNESITLHRRGPCDASAVQRAFSEIIRRHEIWRTTFEIKNGRPVQRVHPPREFELQVSDLRQRGGSNREDTIKAAVALATEDARRPFDLTQGPLLRARLVHLADDEHRLYFTAHQSIVDGVTVYDVFPFELTNLYESYAAGQTPTIPDLGVQFSDFVRDQRRCCTQEVKERELEYWEKQLRGSENPLAWPRTERPAQQTFRGAILPFMLGREITESLRRLAEREGVTLFMVLLAGLSVVLSRYSDQDDIVIGTLAPGGRKLPRFQRLVGYFLNPVPLRMDTPIGQTFRQLLQQARAVTLGAISNDDLLLEEIAERMKLPPDPSRNPFFTVTLSVAPDVPALPPGWNMTFMDVESGAARWEFYLEFSDRAEGMMGRAQYNPDIYSPQLVQNTIDELSRVLSQAALDPAQTIDNIVKMADRNQS